MDDEHFLQNIRLAPTDAKLRAEYSDWLCSQDTARADFVRRELVWQEDLVNRHERLQQLELEAAQFDPVWVARLCRPPLGICCNNLRFLGQRPKISSDALRYLEELLNVELPAQYRAFLLNENGGLPTLTHLILPDGESREVQALLSVFSPQGEPLDLDEDLVGFAQVQFVGAFPPLPPECKPGLGLPNGLIKIGYCQITGFGDTLCLGYKGPRRGQVWLLDPCTLPWEEKIEHFVAPTFGSLLYSLSSNS